MEFQLDRISTPDAVDFSPVAVTRFESIETAQYDHLTSAVTRGRSRLYRRRSGAAPCYAAWHLLVSKQGADANLLPHPQHVELLPRLDDSTRFNAVDGDTSEDAHQNQPGDSLTALRLHGPKPGGPLFGDLNLCSNHLPSLWQTAITKWHAINQR